MQRPLDAVLHLTREPNNWILKILARPMPVTGVADIGLEQYIRWAFGVMPMRSSSDAKWQETIDKARSHGIKLVPRNEVEGVGRYSAIVDFLDPRLALRGARTRSSTRSAVATGSGLVEAALTYAAKRNAKIGRKISNSALHEIVAALLGYRTFKDLTDDQADQSLEFHLDDAEILVPNDFMGSQQRAGGAKSG